jgi:hypothetical protein
MKKRIGVLSGVFVLGFLASALLPASSVQAATAPLISNAQIAWDAAENQADITWSWAGEAGAEFGVHAYAGTCADTTSSAQYLGIVRDSSLVGQSQLTQTSAHMFAGANSTPIAGGAVLCVIVAYEFEEALTYAYENALFEYTFGQASQSAVYYNPYKPTNVQIKNINGEYVVSFDTVNPPASLPAVEEYSVYVWDGDQNMVGQVDNIPSGTSSAVIDTSGLSEGGSYYIEIDVFGSSDSVAQVYTGITDTISFIFPLSQEVEEPSGPGVPDDGFTLNLAHPALIIGGGVGIAAVLLALARLSRRTAKR